MSKSCYVWRVPFGRYLHFFRPGLFGVALGVSTGCTSTVDSLGKDKAPVVANQLPPSLAPLHGPDTYENVFKENVKPAAPAQTLTSDDVDTRVEAVYQQLFHGDDGSSIAIFRAEPGTDDEASIYDAYHNDVRTEGMGIGMLVSVELNHQTEFDQLWNYSKRELMQLSGPSSGYFHSFCDNTAMPNSCLDPYGMEMFAMSLIFAHDRWRTSTIDGIDYQADALALLDVMLHKEQENGGIVEGYTNTFDSETFLVFDEPKQAAASRTRPSILMPAFYELWYQATGNTVFSQAADAARDFFQSAADPNTGLMPLRAYFDGEAVSDSSTFQTEAYRVFPNMVLDQIWNPVNPWYTSEFNRTLAFFVRQGIEKYGSAYYLDGTPVADKTDHEIALVIVNGVTASGIPNSSLPAANMTPSQATISASDKQHYIQDVWDTDIPSGSTRYYPGIMQLFAMCVLSGKMQVY